MKIRPWPIVILAWIHVLGPIGNIFLSAWVQKLGPLVYLAALFKTESVWALIDFFALFPLAGVAIYLCRKWSYPVFLSVAAWTVYSNFDTWTHARATFPLAALIATVLLDVLFVGYFLIPAVRSVYMDPRIRWWEQKPRYAVDIPVRLAEAEGQVLDISEGGIFVRTAAEFNPGTPVSIAFSILENSMQLEGVPVYRRRGENPGYGIQFLHTSESQHKLKGVVRLLRKNHTPTRMPMDKGKDFVEWLTRFVKTGRGWIPEPVAAQKSAEQSST